MNSRNDTKQITIIEYSNYIVIKYLIFKTISSLLSLAMEQIKGQLLLCEQQTSIKYCSNHY